MKFRRAVLQTFSLVSGLGAVVSLFFWVSVVFDLGDPALGRVLPRPSLTLPVLALVLGIVAWRVSPDVDDALKGVLEALLESVLDLR